MTFDDLFLQDLKRYLSLFILVGFEKISSKPVQVLLLRKPHITSVDDIFYSDLAETAQIVCVAEMSPHKARISWSFKVFNWLMLLYCSSPMGTLIRVSNSPAMEESMK